LTLKVEAANAGAASAHTTSSAQMYAGRALGRRVLAICSGWPFYDPWGGKRIIAAKLFLSQPIFSVDILPKLVAADGDAGGNRENGTERAPRGVLAAAAGDEQDVLALHGDIFYLGAQHFLQANGDLVGAGTLGGAAGRQHPVQQVCCAGAGIDSGMHHLAQNGDAGSVILLDV